MFVQKLRSSRGDSVLVPGLVLTVVVVLLLGLVVDTAKNSFARDTLGMMAQQSADAAVKTADNRGSLSWKVLPALQKEYAEQKSGKKGTADVSAMQRNSECSTGMIDLNGDGVKDKKVSFPYYKVSLETGRGKNAKVSDKRTVQFSAGQTPSAPQLKTGAKYTVVNMVVYDSVSNFMLDMLGQPCQVFESNVSAITFGSMEDVS